MLPLDAKPLDHLVATPSQVAAAWPKTQPIVALIGNGDHSKWSRWSIIAPADGTVITAGKDRYLGKFIKIKHDDKFTTLYGHLLQREVKKGQKVKRGDPIGLMGNTGLSTGYHLHYEVRKDKVHVNPRNYILNFNTSNTMIAMY